MRDIRSGVSGVPAARLKEPTVSWFVDLAAASGAPGTLSEPEGASEVLKRAAADAALREVKSDMRIGLGTGSTVRWAIEGLAREVAAGRLSGVVAIPTSRGTADLAASLSIPLSTLETVPELDLAIDGADELDPALNLIKGGGGALLREKIVAGAARRFVVIADGSKRVDRLLASFPLPVEVDPFGWATHVPAFAELGARSELRMSEGQPFRTDGGHYILDLRFDHPVSDLQGLDRALRARPGVLETGLFLAMAARAYVAGTDGVEVLEPTRDG
jgi:ribose 5-phosphate isomerase A